MSLEKKIEEKLNLSLKNKDKNVFPTLRLIISAIKDEKSINQIKSKLESTMYSLTKRANRNNK